MGVDDEVDEFIRNSRRAVTLRFIGVGAALVVVGLALYFYGHQLEEEQARSQAQFTLPTRLMFVGVIGGAIGAILLAIGGARAVRK